MNTKDFFIKTLIMLIGFIFLEILTTSLLPSLFSSYSRFFILGFLCVYLSLNLNSSFVTYMFLALCYVHSFFSLEGWASNTLIALILHFLITLSKDLINLGSLISTIIFYFVTLFLWDLLRVLVFSLKLGSFENIFNVLWVDIVSNIILAFLSPLFVFIMSGLWQEKSSIENA